MRTLLATLLIFSAVQLFPTSTFALMVPNDSFLVMGSDPNTDLAKIRVFDQSGLLVDTLDVPYPGVLDTIEPFAGDLIFHDNQFITVYNGRVDTSLSTYDILNDSWTHYTTPNWSGVDGSFGGIDILDQYIYLADTSVFFGGPQGTKSDATKGIVRFDLQTSTFDAMTTPNGILDVSVGDDGLLYALESTRLDQKLLIIDPVTMNIIKEVVVPNSPDLLQDRLHGVSVDVNGRIFLAGPDKIYEIDMDGNIVSEIPFDRVRNNISGAPFDIDIYNGNMLAVGDAFDTVTLYNLALDQQDRFDGGFQFGSVYVEHVQYSQNTVIPEPGSLFLFSAGLLGLGLRRTRKS